MTTYTRSSGWNAGGTFENPDLLWYAKGVGAMQARALNDPSSWWFFAAIHGEYVKDKRLPGWGALPAPPPVPTSPKPSQSVWDQYWDQCQHQSWYFLPWHRGYLIALEAHIRTCVVNLGGPSTWALPYWDYLGPRDEFNIPPAFTQQNLPGGSPNPLYVAARYGPDKGGAIYVPTPEAIRQHPGDINFVRGPVLDQCMTNDLYSGTDIKTKPPGFGGPRTGFWHAGGTSGNLENNPHNLVHTYVGGNSPDGRTGGLMSDLGLAALDPIFYLHHANIDRMWAVWNLANADPTDPNWLNGPASTGGREFVMPMPDGSAWVYTPQQMGSLRGLNYTYDALPEPVVVPAAELLAQRLNRLGATAAASKVQEGAVTAETKMELVGASQRAIPIGRTGVSVSVKLDAGVRRKVAASLAGASETAPPDRVYLNLENVRGARDATVLTVFVNVPQGERPADHPELLAGSVGLFGLRQATLVDGKHAGEGLSFVLDITKIVDALHMNHTLDADSLTVTLVPHQAVPDKANITVGRISIYRQGSEPKV